MKISPFKYTFTSKFRYPVYQRRFKHKTACDMQSNTQYNISYAHTVCTTSPYHEILTTLPHLSFQLLTSSSPTPSPTPTPTDQIMLPNLSESTLHLHHHHHHHHHQLFHHTHPTMSFHFPPFMTRCQYNQRQASRMTVINSWCQLTCHQ